MQQSRPFVVYAFFTLALIANIIFSLYARNDRASWANVPPAPSQTVMSAVALSDNQLAYRVTGLMLQNFGNGGGQYASLRSYNYENVGEWLFLSDKLDPISDFVPLLAANYFGSTQNPSQLTPVIDYLETIGKRDEQENWRWLLQAVYLARWRMHDYDRALILANELAAQWRPGRQLWMKEMPAFVMTAAGDRKAALGLMLRILDEEKGKVDPAEVNTTIIFVCKKILTPEDAATNPLCTSTVMNTPFH